MRRRALLEHLKDHGCGFLREGTRHAIYANRAAVRSSAVPRHPEITDDTARKIRKDLGVPPP